MDSVGTAINAVVVAGVGLLLWLATRGNRREVRELRTEMNAGFAEVDSRFESLEARLDARFASVEARLDARIDAVHADLTRIALAVGVPREAEASG
jgi:hypothetical protein